MRVIRIEVLFIISFICSTLVTAADPSASLSADVVEFCDTGEPTVRIALEGETPFGFKLKSRKASGAWIIQKFEDIKIGDPGFEDGVYTIESVLLNETTTFEVVEIADQTTGGVFIDNVGVPSSVTVEVFKTPMPDAGVDQTTICGYAYDLEVTPSDASSSILWGDVTGGIFSDNTAYTPRFTADETGTYVLNVRETNGICSGVSSVSLTFLGHLSADILDVSDQIICGTDFIDVSVNISGESPWDVELSNGFSTTVSVMPTVIEDVFVDGEKVISIIEVNDGNGCVSHEDSLHGSIQIIDNLPNADAGDFTEVCGLSENLGALLSMNGSTGKWRSDNSGVVFEDVTLPDARVTVEDYGLYTFHWEEVKGGCSDKAQVDFMFYEIPNAGRDTVLYLKYEVALNAQPESGTWRLISGHGSVVSEHLPNSLVENLSMGKAEFEWTVDHSVCAVDKDTVAVTVKGLLAPNGFSPNGDAINDVFQIGGAAQITNNELKVFDKRGKVVYEQKDLGKDGVWWDGLSREGEKLEDGIYYYVFTGDGVEPIKEFLVIRR